MTAQPPSTATPRLPMRWVQLGLGALLMMLVAMVMVPGYLGGQWPWVVAPQLTSGDLAALHTLRDEGLEMPNWQHQQHQVVALNRQDWSVNEYTALDAAAPAQQMVVLLHPQPWHSNQPQVEWVDLAGMQNWRIERRKSLALGSDADPLPVRANLLQVRNDQQTFAVLQWYAWPGGGHPAPSHWFWVNQRSQLATHTLTPWVAVTVLVPIPPLADLGTYQSWMAELGGQVHQQVTASLGQS
ncbi:MAG: cyanoexosortase B system-associated protein [Spirulina sp.]